MSVNLLRRVGLLLPALLLVLAGCIPTSKSNGTTGDEAVEPTGSSCCDEATDGCCPAEESDAPCCSKCKSASVVELKTIKYDQLTEVVRGHKGKVVVVGLWASFCAPCKKEFPRFVALHEKYGADGVTCISVSVDQAKDADKVTAFLNAMKATFPNYRLDEAAETLQTKLELKSVPAVLVYDREGKRVGKFSNDDLDNPFTYAEQVEPLIRKLVAKK